MVATHFSACISRDWVADAMVSGWLHMHSVAPKKLQRIAALESTFFSTYLCLHVAPEIVMQEIHYDLTSG